MGIKVFLTILHDDKRIRIRIWIQTWIQTSNGSGSGSGRPKNINLTPDPQHWFKVGLALGDDLGDKSLPLVRMPEFHPPLCHQSRWLYLQVLHGICSCAYSPRCGVVTDFV